MAEITNIRNTTPISWPPSNKVHQADKERDKNSRSGKDDDAPHQDERDDDNHIDEYA